MPTQRRLSGFLTAALVFLCLFDSAVAPSQAQDRPSVALIIDDMGGAWQAGLEALALPGALAYAFLPEGAHTRALATLAQRLGKEVLLHAPMESRQGEALGPMGLMATMPRPRFEATLRQQLAAVPGAVGLNNHMGSLLTEQSRPMSWLLETLLHERAKDFMFVDSATTTRSVALPLARQYGLKATRRDVFLDHDVDPDAMDRQWHRWLNLARRRGSALAIAHPRASSLQFLQRRLPQLAEEALRLVPLRELIALQTGQPQPISVPFTAALEQRADATPPAIENRPEPTPDDDAPPPAPETPSLPPIPSGDAVETGGQSLMLAPLSDKPATPAPVKPRSQSNESPAISEFELF